MTMLSSQSITSESEMMPELIGDSNVLIPVYHVLDYSQKNEEKSRHQKRETENKIHPQKVTIEASHSALEQKKTEHQTVQSELQSATHLGDTVLHLLVTNMHNELALKVFQRDVSLLKARNKKLETPLHYAAKVGNEEVIQKLVQIDQVIVKDALDETNENGDTALHVVAQHGHTNVGCELMLLYPSVAYKVNNETLSSLYIAIIKKYTMMVQTMLVVDPTLACIQFSNGMFPVHVSALMGNMELVMNFMKEYPDSAELLDPCGRNVLHIAEQENKKKLFSGLSVCTDTSVREMISRMNNATDFEGNTPLHIAAMKGHRIDHELITQYIETKGTKFTLEWFDGVMEPLMSVENKWEKTQVIGLGSVLITTVTFAAAFTIPGGYNEDNGTAVLGRRYIFRAFIIANALAFIQGFISLFGLLIDVDMSDPSFSKIKFATDTFIYAASSMVVAFGLGMYVTLSPVCLTIAIILLVITLFIVSPAVILVVAFGRNRSRLASTWRSILTASGVPFLLIFGLVLE